MDPNISKSWDEFLDPNVTRPRLIAASIFIAAFEALKESVVARIRDFFRIGHDETGEKIDPKYQSDVLSRNKSPVYASLEWLKEMSAIDDGDIEAFNRVKTCRNRLAHELFSSLASSGLPPDFGRSFSDLVALLKKVELWWIVNVDIPTNPDYDGEEVEPDSILPGRLLGLQLLVNIALGDEERSRDYLEQFRKQHGGG